LAGDEETGEIAPHCQPLSRTRSFPRGATKNLNSLLYLRGVDTAIINSDALEEYRIQVPEIRRRITYLLNLFPSELHIFVRPEIESLQDLAGQKVNFNTQGTAAAYSGPLIFSRLGINAENTFLPHQVALEQMRKGRDGGRRLHHVEAGRRLRKGTLGARLQVSSGEIRKQIRGLLPSRGVNPPPRKPSFGEHPSHVRM
jgi:hypothetical protein